MAGSARSWRAPLAERLLWVCPPLSVLVAGLLLWSFGLTPWTAALAALLLGCPIAVAWVLIAARREQRSSNREGDR